MTQFKSQSDLVRDKLHVNATDIAAAERDAADSPEAAIRLIQLQARRRQLEAEAAQAAQREHQATADAGRKLLEGQHRGAAQHAGALRKSAEALQSNIQALAASWGAFQQALDRLRAVTGGHYETYPDMNIAALKRLVEEELARVGCSTGYVPDLPGARMPPSGRVDDLAPLSERVDRLSRFWLGRHRASLGLANAGPHSDAQGARTTHVAPGAEGVVS